MTADRRSANARALERILSVEPKWTAVRSAREALALPDHVLLHAGPPLPDPRTPPPPMLNAAVLACLYEGWAKTEAEAEGLIAAGTVKLQPTYGRRCSSPLACMISAGTTLAVIESGAGNDAVRWHSFLGTGGGARDPVHHLPAASGIPGKERGEIDDRD